MRNFTLGIATAAILASLAGPAGAAPAVTSFQVSATVISTCRVSATDLSFGNYSPVAPSANGSVSTVSVQCTNLTPYSIGLGAGSGTGATVEERKMTKGTETLTYSLYQDPGSNTVWGDTFGGGNAVSAIGDPGRTTVWGNGADGSSTVDVAYLAAVLFTTRSYSIYGRIPAGQNLPAGAYSDTIVVTVDY